jgi:hypothetical protein
VVSFNPWPLNPWRKAASNHQKQGPAAWAADLDNLEREKTLPLPETEQLPPVSLYQMNCPVSSAGWADHFNVEFL